jgi:hypothetical protein
LHIYATLAIYAAYVIPRHLTHGEIFPRTASAQHHTRKTWQSVAFNLQFEGSIAGCFAVAFARARAAARLLRAERTVPYNKLAVFYRQRCHVVAVAQVVIETENVAVPALARAATGIVLNSKAAVVIVAAVAALAENIRGTIKNHAVPSLAIEQSRVSLSGIGQKRLVTLAVFGVVV